MSQSNISLSGHGRISPTTSDEFNIAGEGYSCAMRKPKQDKTDPVGGGASVWEALRFVRNILQSKESPGIDATETYEIPEMPVSFSLEKALGGDIPPVSVSKEAVGKLKECSLSESAEYILEKALERFRDDAKVALSFSQDPELPDYEHFVVHLKTSMEPEEIIREKRELKAQLRDSYISDDLDNFVFTYQI